MKKTNPISVKEIEKICDTLRIYFDVAFDSYFPILDVMNYFESIDLLTIQIMENEDEMFDVNEVAIYNAADNFIYLKESVLEDYENSNYRCNFTLAHEFFHFIQYRLLNYNVIETDYCESYFDPEWQANEFAGQLLIPTKYIDLDVDEMVNKFHVTQECALTRKLKYEKRKNNKNKKSPNNGT